MAIYKIKKGTETVTGFTIETIELKKTICGISWCKITGQPVGDWQASTLYDQDISLIFCGENSEETTIFSQFKVSSIEKGKNTTIRMYSPEAALARETESKSYTAVNFANDIFLPTMKNANLSVKTSDDTIFGKIGGGDNEYMSAYLVQFNETKYDFLMRTTNRSGVPMYFENGQMILGRTGNTIKIDDTSKQDYNDVFFGEEDTAENREDKTYSAEITDNEFYESINKGKYNEYSKERETGDREWMIALRSLNEHSSLMDGVLDGGFKIAQTTSAYATNVSKENNEYNDKYFKDPKGRQYNDKKDSYTQFANYTASSADSRFSDKHYKTVRKAQQEMAKKCIWVRYKTSKEKYFIGDILDINAWGGEYIVVRVEMTASIKNSSWNNTWQYMLMAKGSYGDNGYVITPAADLLAARENENTILKEYEEMEIWEGCKYDEVRRFDGVQQATVVDNQDPKRLGRVRVKYGWQDENSAATPWLKMLTPLATKNGGVCFVPQKDDKCLVGYRNGNIEQPYIAGATFTKDTTPKWGARGHENIISCKNGHSIRFWTPKDFLASIASTIPMLSWLTDLIPGQVHADAPDPTKDSRGGMSYIGGIDISDDACLYEISASSTSRSVTISSNLGKVDVNAFSAINISAPMGDINITGKNVSIIAGNNLKVKAGEELNKDSDSIMSMIGASIKPAIVEKVLFSDLILDLRPLVALKNLIYKPSDGNLCFSSEQFITMEAGEGKVSLPSRDCTTNYTNDREAKSNYIFFIAMIVQEMDRIFEKSLLKVSLGEISIKDAIEEVTQFFKDNSDKMKSSKREKICTELAEKFNTENMKSFPDGVNKLADELEMKWIRPQRPSSSTKYYAKTGRVKSVYSHYQSLRAYLTIFREKSFATQDDTSNINMLLKLCKEKNKNDINFNINFVNNVNNSISDSTKNVTDIKFDVIDEVELKTVIVKNPISIDREKFVKKKRNIILGFIKENYNKIKQTTPIGDGYELPEEIDKNDDWNNFITQFSNLLSNIEWDDNDEDSAFITEIGETLVKNFMSDNIKDKWVSPTVGGIYYSDKKNVTHKLGIKETNKNRPAELMREILTTIR
ncbi:MAG: phage baseplate assembly protein V [Paludibacteraceae bacterium]|nr:phage baseplate assembly protein V [Paludibacteraceae bacterium]